MATRGQYLRDGRVQEGEIVFWGEWEPESDILDEIDVPLDRGPRHIHGPFYTLQRDYEGLQNTDPFVFGEFLYGICQQHARGRPTRMQSLALGSVILFGSHVGGAFVLDTVLVVRDGFSHACAADLNVVSNRIPRVYDDVVLKVLYPPVGTAGQRCTPTEGRTYRLYAGATYAQPVHGMFGFFPCVPRAEVPRGFARPVIRLPGVVNDGLKQKYAGTRTPRSLDDVQVIWRSVVDQVTAQGLCLGVAAATPECRSRSWA